MAKTSILILTKDKPHLIGPCVTSLLKNVDHNQIEILIGDTGTTDQNVRAFYSRLTAEFSLVRVIDLGAYHFSKNNNALARQAVGDQFLFLNNDTLCETNFVAPLVAISQLPGVGAVGPKLLFADKTIQHAGVEFTKTADGLTIGYHPFTKLHRDFSWLTCNREVPAVTGACLVISKENFFKAQGFDEAYSEESQDVDLCLKLLKLGLKNIYVGSDFLFHFENGTRTKKEDSRDRRLFHRRWAKWLSSHYPINKAQSKPFDVSQPNSSAEPCEILHAVRLHARGDVLASTAVLSALKKQNPNSFLVFETSFPELVDPKCGADIVVKPGDPKAFEYVRTLDLAYEDGEWMPYDHTFVEEMARRAGLNPHESFDLRPAFELNDFELSERQSFQDFLRHRKYAVIATKAGQHDRDWDDRGWESLVSSFVSKGLEVIQIGGLKDTPISNALDLRGLDLASNWMVFKYSQVAVLLDSFPLHIALAAKAKIVWLTCKTSHLTAWVDESTIELRNIWAEQTPFIYCKSFGCRQRFGTCLENVCDCPILKNLAPQRVFEAAIKKMANQ